MTRELEEAMDDMCNVIEYYERKTRVEALAEGKEAGIVEGEVNTMLKAIEKIEKNMNLSREEAMEILEIDEELKTKILDRLNRRKS